MAMLIITDNGARTFKVGSVTRCLCACQGLTLLHIAAIRDRVDIMRVLIRRGLEVRNQLGRHP